MADGNFNRVGTLFQLLIPADELGTRLVLRLRVLTSAGTSMAVSTRINSVLRQLQSGNYVALDLLWTCSLLWNGGDAADCDVVRRAVRELYPPQVANLCDQIDRKNRTEEYPADPAVAEARQILQWFGIPDDEARALLFQPDTYERVERIVVYLEMVARTFPGLLNIEIVAQRMEGIRFSHRVLLTA